MRVRHAFTTQIADEVKPGGRVQPSHWNTDHLILESVHASDHEVGGADEINVDGLPGLLADPQTPLPHGDHPFTDAEKLALEMELAFKASRLLAYSENTYAGGVLTAVSTYENATKVVQLFGLALAYNPGGQLTSSVLTRTSDSATLTKALVYNPDGTLASITRS